jgi:hypothetical protein
MGDRQPDHSFGDYSPIAEVIDQLPMRPKL